MKVKVRIITTMALKATEARTLSDVLSEWQDGPNANLSDTRRVFISNLRAALDGAGNKR